VARDPEGWPLPSRERAIVDYAIKLTRTPAAVREADLDLLRREGLDDEAVLFIADTVAYFNYVNRLADGLGVKLEPGHRDALVEETEVDS
jgi:uncharacterized peroxidase-related enzyme